PSTVDAAGGGRMPARSRSKSLRRRLPRSRLRSSSMSSRRRRRIRLRRPAGTSAGSAAARDRMAARGSERLLDVVEELVVELPARLRGGQARLSEHAVGPLPTLADQLTLL